MIYINGSTAVQIVASVRRAVDDGKLHPGTALPSVRVLADTLGVNRNTVAAAFQRLATLGVTESSNRGTRVASRLEGELPVEPDYGASVRDLSLGNPDPDLLPDLSAAMLAALARPRQFYGGAHDVPELIELAATLARGDGIAADHMAIVGGASDGMDRVLSAQLGPGDIVAVEDPCFTRILALVRALGLAPFGLAMDDEGILPEALAAALAAGARAIIVTPSAQNPTGATLTEGRAATLRGILARAPRTLLIEDDHYRRLTVLAAHSLAAPAVTERWAVIRSFAKCLGPDLRLGVLMGDRSTVERVRARQAVGIQWMSHLLQWVAVELVRAPGTRSGAAKAGRVYAARRSALLAALRDRDIAAHGAEGLHVWVPTARDEPAARHLLAQGWAVRTGAAFRIGAAGGLRITSAVLEVTDAVALADAVAVALRPRRRTFSG